MRLLLLLPLLGVAWAQAGCGREEMMGKLVKFMECKETEMEMVRSELDGAREEQLGIALDAVQQCFAESSCPDPKERMKETGMCVMGVFNDQVKPQIEAECDGAEIPEPPMEMMEMMGRKQKRKMVKKIIQKMALFGKLISAVPLKLAEKVSNKIMGKIKSKMSGMACDGDEAATESLLACVGERLEGPVAELKALKPSREERRSLKKALSSRRCGAKDACLESSGLAACRSAFEAKRQEICACGKRAQGSLDIGAVKMEMKQCFPQMPEMPNRASMKANMKAEMMAMVQEAMRNGDVSFPEVMQMKSKMDKIMPKMQKLMSKGPPTPEKMLKKMAKKFCGRKGPFSGCDGFDLPDV